MAIIFDTGKVTNRRNALDLKRLSNDVGMEVRFHGPAVTPLRLGIARGKEGWHLVFGGSAAF
jgi:outer membrane translocation and assembly module TamA